MSVRSRIFKVAAAAIVIGGSALWMVNPAFASGSGEQWCGYLNNNPLCLNAWGGGPNVNIYEHLGTSNNDFTAYRTTNGYYELEFTGGGGDTGLCVGDAANNPNNANTGLDNCPNSGNAGWGTYMQLEGGGGCPDGTYIFHDNHWNGYLGPPSNPVQGEPFYLNNYNYECFYTYDPA
jgi:hypothetical protein